MKMFNFGLIGNPVTNSKSDHYHNSFLSNAGINEQYSKFNIKPNQLKDFLKLAKQRQMKGLSVTMPLKECIIPLLDEVDPEAMKIGAVNTVKFNSGKTKGYNTDVKGSLLAIKHCYKQTLSNKKVLIVGAGGVAKAIARGLNDAGMKITIVNRTMEKATNLANSLNAEIATLSNIGTILKNDCDFLIQATSIGMTNQDVIIQPSEIPKHILVFDVVSNPQNGWLDKISQQGNLTISGKLFWIYQAILQYNIWYNNKFDISWAFSYFKKAIESIN